MKIMSADGHHHLAKAVKSTTRVVAFSDGVYAIVATLLVLELRVPALEVTTTSNLVDALWHLLPELIAFVFSFLVVVIAWVNHHHFFYYVEKTDWLLLWGNNFHLFWIAMIPFTTDLIGRYPAIPLAVAIYAMGMTMVASSFLIMTYYVFFRSELMHSGFSERDKHREFRRGLKAIYLYLAATVAAFAHVYAAFAILIITAILFVIPRLLESSSDDVAS